MYHIRLVLSLISLYFTTLVNLPPRDNEIQSGDKLADGGQVSNFFFKQILSQTVFTFLVCHHMIYHGEHHLAYDEYILFGIIVVGFLLRMWCYWTLGKFFTFNLLVKEDHKLITSGPYRYLVHPSYTGQLITTFATALFLKGYLVFFILLLYALKILFTRIKKEEVMLTEKFGDEYLRYQQARWKLIPFIY
jgi:protein-S-isoprenylcysteine O-methyltransferase Ste14